jgi:hypothetical protein
MPLLDIPPRVEINVTEGGPALAPTFSKTLFSNHGQSFDWIFYGNPMGMICGQAAQSPRANVTIA